MFFLYHKTTRPTGRVLAKALGFQHFGLALRNRPDFLVRWGNAIPVPIAPGREINSTSGISRASNKLAAFNIFKEANVRVPWFTRSQAEAQARYDAGEIIFGRTTHGSKGRGITVYDGIGARLGVHELYTEFIPTRREYRLHVVGDQVVRIQRKYLEKRAENDTEYIKNYANGYVFKQPRTELKPDRKALAVAAIKALGLDFGAVDMVIDAEGTAIVLEVNTAPACSPLTGRAYVSALLQLIAERSGGDYAPQGNYGELQALNPSGEEADPRAAVLAAF